ncbi:PELOTA RNA binding domain-containing protein [Sphingobium sp. AP50]|uniref:cysteine protease StiP domain-containing protein n=1 Tax=Sphingobium sp. AP50 TaxID=1884369 RepID=UPI0008B34A7B|nr:cysteine protease StiP domain-containing protein [Sphingobium sp. AP50]SEJ12193.1 PELOTA RNA binding domain-containing protein [Sphingobium sp. AP50]
MRIDADASPVFSGSYDPQDVTFLLKPVSMAATDVAAKEAAIQSGRRHYSEMIAPESIPDDRYLGLYHAALARNGARLAQDVASLAARLVERRPGREIILVSLARAGTPIGVLLARTLRAWGHRASHYSISIIRDRGIDPVALAHIAERHDPRDAIFIDGWTGKGAIAQELRRSLDACPHGFAPALAVIADPAGQADIAASDDDYLIASGLLNGIVSGLVSRSILNTDVVGPGDFHACVTYPHYAHADMSHAFIAAIAPLAAAATPRSIAGHAARRAMLGQACETMVEALLAKTGSRDRNRIKPGIAEATRALLRRMPERLLIRDRDDADVAHLLHLAAGHAIPIEPLGADSHYRAVAIIRSLGNDR